MMCLCVEGESLRYHLGMNFSTPDQDNDDAPHHCAVVFKGAWWYKSCIYSNLNGLYGKVNHIEEGVSWYQWKWSRFALKFTEMKLRPFNF